MLSRRTRLPRGRHFAVTWSIDDAFGGMTSTMLRRSRAFVAIGGVSVDVLTFGVRDDWPRLEADLRARGELVDGMRLLNLWSWMGAASHTEHRDAEGGVPRIDHHRADGSLVVSDLRGQEAEERVITWFDRDGAAVRSWDRPWSLYYWWLDELSGSGLSGSERSWFIVDSKTSANFMVGYRRPASVVAHVIHNSHLTAAGELRESRRRVLERLRRFDVVAVLTERQRSDIIALLGDPGTLRVIPNPHDVQPAPAPRGEHGVVLASLTGRKRVGLAIRAAAAAGVRLDVYGEGERRVPLERLIGRLGAGDRVRLRGHRPDARSELAAASFVLLTGSAEGFPLVLVEAMAAGCIPIAIDVPYGPADLIRHRVNGFLVPDADGLAPAIRELQSMSPESVARMRRAARRTARRYSDVAAVRRWSRALRGAAR